MRYSKYPSYRDSGVEWLGEIPEQWESTRLCNLGILTASGIDKKLKEDEPFVHIINFTDIHKALNCELTSNTSYMKVTAPIDKKIAHQVDKGDLIFTPSSETIEDIGISALVDEELTATAFSYHVLRFQFTNPLNHSYRKYITNNTFVLSQFSMKARGTTRQTLGRDDFRTINLALPPLQEQQTISNYLDKATAKIDTLIAKQTKLIELLKEKRQAVISTAVTRGLDNTVAMKDSGVEWLGEIPEHWRISKVKFESTFKGGSTPSKDKLEYWNGDIFWVSPKDMKSRYINSSIDTITIEGKQSSNLAYIHSGSVLIVVRSGILQRTIPIALTTGTVTVNQDIKALKFKQSLMAKYFIALVEGLTPQLLLEWRKQGATVESIETEYLANSPLLVPPISEIKQILEYLDIKNTKTENLITKATKAIDLLKEKRTALISSAVTGKIDVRELV